jgi:hypothetical protein
MSKVSLRSQIAAVRSVAEGEFPIVASSNQKRGLVQEHLRAAVATLRWLEKNEAAIRSFIERQRGGAA